MKLYGAGGGRRSRSACPRSTLVALELVQPSNPSFACWTRALMVVKTGDRESGLACGLPWQIVSGRKHGCSGPAWPRRGSASCVWRSLELPMQLQGRQSIHLTLSRSRAELWHIAFGRVASRSLSAGGLHRPSSGVRRGTCSRLGRSTQRCGYARWFHCRCKPCPRHRARRLSFGSSGPRKARSAESRTLMALCWMVRRGIAACAVGSDGRLWSSTTRAPPSLQRMVFRRHG